jgi:hypothetical protein
MRHLAGAMLVILAAASVALGAAEVNPADGPKGATAEKKPAAAKAAPAKEEDRPVKVPGVIAEIKSAAKDFEDFGPVKDQGVGLPKCDNVYCVVGQPGKEFDDQKRRLHIGVVRCSNAHGAQQRAIIYVGNVGPKALPLVTEGPLAGVGDVCYYRPAAAGAPAWEPRYAEVAFARNNITVRLMAEAGSADLKLMEDVAQRIDKALAGWVVDPKKMPKPAPVEGTVAALDFAAKDFADLGGQVATRGDKPPADAFVADVTRGRRSTPEITLDIQRFPTVADALKAYTPNGSEATTSHDEADAIRLADLGDRRHVEHDFVAEAYVSTPIRSIEFVRNNVIVRMQYGGMSSGVPDFEALARRIDKHLIGLLGGLKEAKPEPKAP